jgi:16S rRNA (cytosine967-C5)-methyltransferase
MSSQPVLRGRVRLLAAELCDLQDQLLASAATLVRPGGLLVYSTCSIEPEEHQGRLEAFMERTRGAFTLEPPPPGLLPAAVLTPEGCVTTLPHVHDTDGAFAVRLRRRL